ncbi:hypothetical protein S245_024687, partial [Arachis hypogaea]
TQSAIWVRTQWCWLSRSRRRASGRLWKLRLKPRSKLSSFVELILMSFQVIELLCPRNLVSTDIKSFGFLSDASL